MKCITVIILLANETISSCRYSQIFHCCFLVIFKYHFLIVAYIGTAMLMLIHDRHSISIIFVNLAMRVSLLFNFEAC